MGGLRGRLDAPQNTRDGAGSHSRIARPDPRLECYTPGVMATPLPMLGTAAGTVKSVRPVSIHGDLYHDLAFLPDGESEPVAVRVPSHLCSVSPEAGTRLSLELLMGQVSGVRREPVE